MNKSESIKNLALSFHKAQSEMSGAKKGADNPFFKSKYANLEEVIHCVKKPFADNGLSFMQFPITHEDRAGVETIIMHESGEWMSSEFMLKCSKLDPQGMASAITYARRYGLQAAAGIPSEDDDGQAASTPAKAKAAAPKKPTASEGIAIALSADPEAKWFEIMAPTKNEPYAGSTLGDIVVQKDVAFLEKMNRFIEKHAAQYPLAVKRLEMAISEAGK